MRARATGAAVLFFLAASAVAQDKPPPPGSRKHGIDPKAGPSSEKAPEKYDPRVGFAWRKGDKRRMVNAMKAEHLLTYYRGNQPVHVENRTDGFEIRYVDAVAAVTAHEGVTKIDRTYERVKDFATGREDRKPKTVSLDYTRPKMVWSKEETTDLHPLATELLDNASKRDMRDLAQLYPQEGEVEIGQEWEIPPDAIARLWLLDDLHLDDGHCTGVLAARRTVRGVEQVKMVLTLRLRMRRLWDSELEFDPPAELETEMEVWSAAQGEHPDEEATMRGSISGRGKLPESAKAPKDARLEVKTTMKGEFKATLVAATR